MVQKVQKQEVLHMEYDAFNDQVLDLQLQEQAWIHLEEGWFGGRSRPCESLTITTPEQLIVQITLWETGLH